MTGAHNTKERRTSITILWYQSLMGNYQIWKVPAAHGFMVFHAYCTFVGAYVNSHSTFQVANVPKDRPAYSTEN